ncbi:MAG: F0F1 ATP synthase subunit epsilon [Actinobacteria bacterium]|nr:F0F1 ATP synthase subunit epsilon [Actinomycetota bacterium]MCB9413566.1 F0F1 ATP synthase subunit epsilon [Actinomycetota bacterium]
MAELTVRLVATDKQVYTGQASLVVFETVDGQMGIMPAHSPMMAILRDAPVLIRTVDNGDLYAAVHGGFVTVDGNTVIILAESAELAHDIDTDIEKRVEAEIGTPADDDEASKARLKRAQVRLSVAAKSTTTTGLR